MWKGGTGSLALRAGKWGGVYKRGRKAHLGLSSCTDTPGSS